MKKIVDEAGLEQMRQDIEDNYSSSWDELMKKKEDYWGLSEYTLTKKDIEALTEGKIIVLSVRDEYLVSIRVDPDKP